MTNNKPGLVALSLTPTADDGAKDGQCAVTPDGTVWQRRKSLWYQHPWWQRCDAKEITAICADPQEYAYNLGWTREQIEASIGALAFVTLPDHAAGEGS